MKQEYNYSVSRVAAHEYLLSDSYGGSLLDVEAGTVAKIEEFSCSLSLVVAVMLLVKDDIWVYFGHGLQPAVYRNRILVGQLPDTVKSVLCNNGWATTGKFVADAGGSLLFVDDRANLVEHKWADIMAGNFTASSIVSTGVSDFALHGSKPVILKTDKTLVLENGLSVNLATFDSETLWSALAVAGNRILVGGDLNNKGKLIVLNKEGVLRGQTDFDLHHNGHSQGTRS